MLESVLWGLAGGIIGNLLRLVTIANTPREARPSNIFDDPMYYVQFIVLALIGAFFALLYEKSGTHLTPVLAVNVGAAAPVIARQFLSGASPADPAN